MKKDNDKKHIIDEKGYMNKAMQEKAKEILKKHKKDSGK